MKRSSFSRIKDAALEQTVLLLLRPKLERYGELRSISLDTTARRIAAEVRLLGDPIPVEISDARYRVETQDEQCRLTFFEVKTSKAWLQHLIDDRFPEITLSVPAYLRPLL
jgi:hypothetical protein